MRILVLGDSHANSYFIKDAFGLAGRMSADLIYVAGDFGYWVHTKEGQIFLELVDKLANHNNIPLWFCDGNHDNHELLYQIPLDDGDLRRVTPHVIHTPRGVIWEWDGVRFMAMGGAHSIDGPGGVWTPVRGPGNNWWPQETITDDEVATAVANLQSRTVDVMFTHDAPTGAAIPKIKGYPAGNINRDKLRVVAAEAKPRLLVHGHYHRFYTQDGIPHTDLNHTTIIGLDCDTGRDYQWMVIDTNDGNLKWYTPATAIPEKAKK